MSDMNQKVSESAGATPPKDRPMDLRMIKTGDITHVTFMGDPSAFMLGFGTSDLNFLLGLLDQVANAGSKGEGPDELAIKFMLAFIKETKPRDEIEAALLTQMAAIHVAAMRYANRLAHVESLQKQDSAERALNKLMRTFAVQVAAFQHYRSISEQKVILQNAQINDSGQAIAGNVGHSAHEAARKIVVTPILAASREAWMETVTEAQNMPSPLRGRQKR